MNPPNNIPANLKARYTAEGKIPVIDFYLDEAGGSTIYSYSKVEQALAEANELLSKPSNQDVPNNLIQAFKDFPIKGKKVLVVGSRYPLYEALVVVMGGRPVSVEFGKIETDHPLIETITTEELNSYEHTFDAAISISSYEHTGLGRYGDPLDPEGDLKSMQDLKKRLVPSGLLYLAVPVGLDALVWNAHRIYGSIRLPLLLAGWERKKDYGYPNTSVFKLGEYVQPVFVLGA